MWQCPHREFLTYFDRVHGLQSVWYICDFCKIRFGFEVLETVEAPTYISDYFRSYHSEDGD